MMSRNLRRFSNVVKDKDLNWWWVFVTTPSPTLERQQRVKYNTERRVRKQLLKYQTSLVLELSCTITSARNLPKALVKVCLSDTSLTQHRKRISIFPIHSSYIPCRDIAAVEAWTVAAIGRKYEICHSDESLMTAMVGFIIRPLHRTSLLRNSSFCSGDLIHDKRLLSALPPRTWIEALSLALDLLDLSDTWSQKSIYLVRDCCLPIHLSQPEIPAIVVSNTETVARSMLKWRDPAGQSRR